MKNIIVCYKEQKLGSLSFDGKNYIYKSNKKAVEKANEKGYSPFLFSCDKDWVNSSLPLAFEQFLPSLDQSDLMMLANITPYDNDYIKLCKIASLNSDKNGFYLVVE